MCSVLPKVFLHVYCTHTNSKSFVMSSRIERNIDFIVFLVSFGDHFGKWLPRASEDESEMALPLNLLLLGCSRSVQNLVLLSKSAQFFA